MKFSSNYFVLVFLLLAVIPFANAQYGYNNGYNNPYNRGRQSLIPRAPEPERKPENLTAEQIVDREMPRIIEAIDLNDFEQAVVTAILTKYVQQSIELQILKLPADKAREAAEKIRINQKAELQAGLPEDKFNKLVELQKQGYKKLKKQKKKKKKKKEKEQEKSDDIEK
ncbi:MAG: hypothetical protein JSV59_03625 [Flavobacteriaceae bacterium]|nr:MAG: hypothetical protein JSV59_03625 [Flavobacteriaceae bacterium]